MRRVVRDHWYRPTSMPHRAGSPEPCALASCPDRDRVWHWVEVGEWLLPVSARWRRIAGRAVLRRVTWWTGRRHT